MVCPGEDTLALLERSLGFTRSRLAVVRPHHLARPTPCAGWDLDDLLAHLDDALDAFTEAAAGWVTVVPPPLALPRVDTLQHKAGALLGAWLSASAPAATVLVGDSGLDASWLVAAAALEITLHGWDVGWATGEAAAVPETLATDLLDVAHRLVDRTTRAPHFAPARPVDGDAPASLRLLGWTGRGTEPLPWIPAVPPAQGGLAS